MKLPNFFSSGNENTEEERNRRLLRNHEIEYVKQCRSYFMRTDKTGEVVVGTHFPAGVMGRDPVSADAIAFKNRPYDSEEEMVPHYYASSPDTTESSETGDHRRWMYWPCDIS